VLLNSRGFDMKKMVVLQIVLFIVFAGSFIGMLAGTDVYGNIKSTIVDTTCFSCIKMDPVSEFVFTFETVDNKPHPDFILENLSEIGPVFLAFRQDVCSACEIMEPLLKEMFDIEFGKKDLFYQTIEYNGDSFVFYHINIDDPYEKETEGFYIYDKDQRGGVPMFVLITLGNNSGNIEPYYITAYSTLGKESKEERKTYFDEMISVGLELYKINKEY
jgi:hypothetical protein